MTIKIPEKSLADQILAALGKKRAVFLPKNVAINVDHRYIYAQARKESFLKALLRPKNNQPPDGWVYTDKFDID
ncbi:MAG: hypothetical protein U9Q58_01120 [Pseudomonadota bacterium]|nr:hypothetical protein [Pseudomonadota bacterium]